MERAAAPALALAAALLLAGCVAPGTGGFPPGLDRGGVTDAGALADAHAAALANASYSVRVDTRIGPVNGTGGQRGSTVERIGADGTFALESRETGDATGRPPAVWGNETVTFLRSWNGTDPEYVRFPTESAPRFRYAPQLPALVESVFADVPLRYTGPVERNGTVLRRFAGSDDDSVAFGTATDLSAVALVTDRGVVRELQLAYDSPSGPRTARHVAATVRVFAVGATAVERPSWVTEAVRLTTRTDRR